MNKDSGSRTDPGSIPAGLDTLPVFNSDALFSGTHRDHKQSIERLAVVVSDIGFLVLRGEAVPSARIRRTLGAYRDFFALSEAHKAPLDMAMTGSNRGWGRSACEQVNPDANPDYKEVFDCGVELEADDVRSQMTYYAPNCWPTALLDFRKTLIDYYAVACQVALQLLQCVLKAIDAPGEHFDQAFTHPLALLRGNYYPPRPQRATALDYGIAPHTDYGCLTLLTSNETSGLEIQTRQGEWIPVSTGADEYVVNFGEMLAIWTANRVRSTLHRVIGPKHPRYSTVLFFNPNYDTNIAPAGTRSRLAGDYLSKRYDQTYTHRQHQTGQYLTTR